MILIVIVNFPENFQSSKPLTLFSDGILVKGIRLVVDHKNESVDRSSAES